VVSYSQAHSTLPELRRFPFVIVDESHTLRNDTRRDYKAIQDYIHANDSKVLLLTATPYNIRFRDVANQLGLFIDDDDDLGISPTGALMADPNLADKVDGKVTTMAAFRRSEDPDDWKRLMSEHSSAERALSYGPTTRIPTRLATNTWSIPMVSDLASLSGLRYRSTILLARMTLQPSWRAPELWQLCKASLCQGTNSVGI
jgi:hypothetical protein